MWLEIKDKQTNKMPEKSSFVEFKNCHRQIKAPFIIVTDFASLVFQTNFVKFWVKATEKIK